MLRLAGIVALTLAPLAQAFAWGDQGHRVVCEIAFHEAAADTRTRIDALIASAGETGPFSELCVWPDHPRKRDDEHYVNLARDAQAIGTAACPLADRCVVAAIAKDVAILADPANSEVARLIALKFLGHFVGDVHQPLHVSFEDDRGGNSVDTTGICGRNLHSAWDTCLLQQAVGTDVAAAVDQLAGEIVSADTWAWVRSGPVDWANESFAITIADPTDYCDIAGATCAYAPGNEQFDPGEQERKVTIDAAYVARSTPIIRDRLKRAGVRLAHLLDQALAP
jgi:S1/P1 Nuclease